MQGRVPDDAARADVFRLEFKLGFDEHQGVSSVLKQGEGRGQDFFQRNEGDVGDDQVHLFSDVFRSHVAGVEFLLHDDAGILPQFPDELVGADVDRVHFDGAVLEQAVRKASGGRADVQADLAFRGDGEGVQGSLHFQAAAADVAGAVPDGNLRVFTDLEARFGGRVAAHAHLSGNDQPLGQFPGFYEIAGNQKDVESLLAHDSEGRCVRRYFMKPHGESRKTARRKAFGVKKAAWRALEHFTIDSARIYRRLCGEWNTATGN